MSAASNRYLCVRRDLRLILCAAALAPFARPVASQDAALQATPVAPARDAYPYVSRHGRIVFQSNRIGGSRIFLLDSIGGEPRHLETGGNAEVTPVWSPDGTRVLFVSTRAGNEDVYVINADGTGLRRLTDHPAYDSHPSWSPDGTRIVFCSTRGDGENDDLFVMNADGSGQTRLTDNGLTWDTFPSFSPDGRYILFRQLFRVRLDLGVTAVNSEIMRMNVDGTDLVNLSRDPWFDGWPSWSPDGRWIAFSSNRSDVYQIYVMRADGSDVRRVSTSEYVEVRPQWTPDGRHLLFNRERDGSVQLWRAPAPTGR
jgi:TolB protein